MFGNPETTTGGRALKFYASVRMDVRRIETLKQGGEMTGNRTRIKIVKNKIAPPFKEAEFDIMFGQGISREGDLLDIAVKMDIINKSGAWFAYNGTKIGQGRENAKKYLSENEEVCKEVDDKVRTQVLAKGEEEQSKDKEGDSSKGKDAASSDKTKKKEASDSDKSKEKEAKAVDKPQSQAEPAEQA